MANGGRLDEEMAALMKSGQMGMLAVFLFFFFFFFFLLRNGWIFWGNENNCLKKEEKKDWRKGREYNGKTGKKRWLAEGPRGGVGRKYFFFFSSFSFSSSFSLSFSVSQLVENPIGHPPTRLLLLLLLLLPLLSPFVQLWKSAMSRWPKMTQSEAGLPFQSKFDNLSKPFLDSDTSKRLFIFLPSWKPSLFSCQGMKGIVWEKKWNLESKLFSFDSSSSSGDYGMILWRGCRHDDWRLKVGKDHLRDCEDQGKVAARFFFFFSFSFFFFFFFSFFSFSFLSFCFLTHVWCAIEMASLDEVQNKITSLLAMKDNLGSRQSSSSSFFSFKTSAPSNGGPKCILPWL